ncbi:MAG: LysM peptidoglycan-binding domain-containing protein [Simkaniaceae bacterium]|nr:LysM peptidoglycan-binding domain-containing protein [Simkaniaceae bacterium]
MNRKDVIVVAILANVGVLILLFISSLRPSSPELIAQQPVMPVVKEIVNEVVAVEEKDFPITAEPIDQVAQVIAAVEKESQIAQEPSSPEDILKTFLAEDLQEIRVEKGDVLGKIARRYQTSVEEIQRLNNLGGSTLQVGQVLYVPKMKKQDQVVVLADQTEKNLTLNSERYYTVKNGDSPWNIAVKNHMKVDELLRLNNLDESKAKKLKPGDRLRIR